MGICWYCYWGWPKQVADIYNDALNILKAIGSDDTPLMFGPAHIVWSDENFESAQWCLDRFEETSNHTPEELAIVKWSLQELVKLPLTVLDMWPDDYDDENPENYPPPDGVEMVRMTGEIIFS